MALLVVLSASVLSSCGAGAGDDAAAPTSAPTADAASLVELDAHAFAERMASQPEALVVNVHVPDEGAIPGTEASVPFDEIVGHADLPDDRSAPLMLYCMSDRMSEEAGAALVDAGYTDVAHLDGGMVAWTATGRDLERR